MVDVEVVVHCCVVCIQWAGTSCHVYQSTGAKVSHAEVAEYQEGHFSGQLDFKEGDGVDLILQGVGETAHTSHHVEYRLWPSPGLL